MLVPIRDFTGSAVLHCHIVEHEGIGMMRMWSSLEEIPISCQTGRTCFVDGYPTIHWRKSNILYPSTQINSL
jgi:hypothetical protein